MAYAVALETVCTEDRCRRPATHEVRNQWNETVRRCCRKHADALVRCLSADEEANW